MKIWRKSNTQNDTKPQSVNWGGRMLNVAIILALVAGLFPASMSPTLRAHPALLRLAAEQPNTTVRVIVQKNAPDADLEAYVSKLGGHVTKDLHFINAFGAEMTASAARELAASPAVRWVSLDAPVESADLPQEVVFTTWATQIGATASNGFAANTAMMDSALGPNGVFGYGENTQGTFSGFVAEVTPGYVISKVEVVLQAYVPTKLSYSEDPKLTLFVAGAPGNPLTLNDGALNQHIGAWNTGPIFIDVTTSHHWQWSDFDNLELSIDQSKVKSYHSIYYDAIGLRVTSTLLDPATINAAIPTDAATDINTLLVNGAVDTTAPLTANAAPLPQGAIDTSKLHNAYNFAVRATSLWNEGPAFLQGQGVTVAVVDSGVIKNRDIGGRVLASINFNADYHSASDRYGHGTFVASIIGGDGKHSGGQYIGIAPKVSLLNTRISDDQGMATESDVVSALQWLYEHKDRYGLRVVNLSLNSSVADSYNTSALDAAVEALWFNGIVVVASAGNNGSATLYPPANDPFVITVGATDDKGSASLSDDTIAGFSAYGIAESGPAKPELVAPGRNIIALLPENKRLTISQNHPGNRIDDNYFRMSGTSMAAPIVSSAAALLLQGKPTLTPDQVKYRLMATANKNWPGYDPARAGAGYLDIYAAVHATATESANTGLQVSQLLWPGLDLVTWGSVNWNSVNWNSVNWNSVNWNSVNWNSVNWNSDYWEP